MTLLGRPDQAGNVSSRVIEQIDLSGGLTVAWCRLWQDERMLNLSRVLTVSQSTGTEVDLGEKWPPERLFSPMRSVSVEVPVHVSLGRDLGRAGTWCLAWLLGGMS
nr:hypothetical protein [Micromonospora sp. DSM 115978]